MTHAVGEPRGGSAHSTADVAEVAPVVSLPVADPAVTLHVKRLTALAEIELTSDALGDVLSRIVHAVGNLLPAAVGSSVILWDDSERRFAVSASSVIFQPTDEPARRVRTEGGATRHIIDTGEPVVVTDQESDPFSRTGFKSDHGVEAYIGVPIVNDGVPIGVLYALDDCRRQWTTQDIGFMETVARRASTAIINANYVYETRRATRHAQQITQVTSALLERQSLSEIIDVVIESTVNAVAADRVLLIAMEDDAGSVPIYHIGGPGAGMLAPDTREELMNGLTGWALRESKTVLSKKDVPDVRESEAARARRAATHGGSIIVAPLRYGEGRAGTLTAIRDRRQPDFDERDAELIEAMANQIAVALEHAHMKELSERAVTEVKALYRVAQALNKEGGVAELLTGLADSVAHALGAERIALTLTDVAARRITHRATAGLNGTSWTDDSDFEEMWDSLAGWALRNRRPALASPHHRDRRESDAAYRKRVEQGLGAVIVVPLLHSGQQLGALVVANGSTEHGFVQRDVDLAGAMAGQMAIAIANALLFEETQRLAVTDELTGISNRRHLFDMGERELRAARRYGRPLAGILFDIDNFKKVNDTYGHSVGDEVLIAVVDRCTQVVREVDVFGRYGGEEFAVVLPEVGMERAREIAERLRAIVDSAPIDTSIGPIAITISVGVAAMSSDMANVQALLDRTDAAMFAAKRKGRNRVTTA